MIAEKHRIFLFSFLQVRAPAYSRWWTGLGGRALMARWSLMSATEPRTALLSRLQWAESRMRARPQE